MSKESKEFCRAQELKLAELQTGYSEQIFTKGILSRVIFGDVEGTLTSEEVNTADPADLDYLEKYHFVPKLTRYEGQFGEDKTALSLGYLRRPGTTARNMTAKLGRMDETGVLVHPFPGLSAADVEQVFEYAQELKELRSSGELPNLSFDLTSIHNPYTMLSNAPRPETPGHGNAVQ